MIPYAKFNIYDEPHTAKAVFSGKVSTMIITLKFCDDCTINSQTK
ncbi:hypothetical protein HMPREF9430_01734 [Solobacterium moorei F0204]|uniref:Uncharacterized protein n=1 Tax=Solobacterium moorei F0204 TaxID=706433 RepID=E7MQ08_9FIRM|nr:hypothetical protein HMPREF9430_01734 [Solobacterium moorei F0204]